MNNEHNPQILLSDWQTEQSFRIKYTIKNPNFFAVDQIANDYFNKHNEKYSLFLIKCDFILIFDSDVSKSIHIEAELFYNTNI